MGQSIENFMINFSLYFSFFLSNTVPEIYTFKDKIFIYTVGKDEVDHSFFVIPLLSCEWKPLIYGVSRQRSLRDLKYKRNLT